MSEPVKADIAIFGGGIAGLWLLTRLRQAGYAAILLETEALGGGQTLKSQGIIHGGMKYALQGVFTQEAATMAELPTLWRACLAGKGAINLKAVPVLSSAHYLWSPGRLASKITGFLAGMAMRSKVAALKAANYPYVFQHPQFKGAVYALDEVVLDVPALVRELSEINRGAIFKIKSFSTTDLHFEADGRFVSADLSLGQTAMTLTAKHVVFAAGEGNAVVCAPMREGSVAMQRRPLHMVMVKTPFYYPLYAHCMGVGPRPRVTITTHRLANGEAVWYLGGAIAEDGVALDSDAQMKAAKILLESLFPWLDFSAAMFATLMVDRAEPHQKNGMKPETMFTHTNANVTIAWPIKLAFAPLLADAILARLQTQDHHTEAADLSALRDWPAPPLAKPAWETCTWKSVV